MSRSVNYDKYEYDYSTYWKGRAYEQQAEEIALKKLLANVSGKRFIDIGGSFGRLLPLYAEKFDEVVILDYSYDTLVKYKPQTRALKGDTQLIAANAYFMPFASNVFDGGLMVRVLHHLSDQPQYLNELSRVLQSKAPFVQEFANKIHLKARLRAFKSRDKTIYNLEPYQQPSQGNMEGSKGEEVPFLNYHPEYLRQLLKDHQLIIDKKVGCSYLRSTPLSRNLPLGITSLTERVLQILFQDSDFAPSVMLKIHNSKSEKNFTINMSFEDTLRCPLCASKDVAESNNQNIEDNGRLNIVGEKATCQICSKQYFLKKGVWDFRV